MSPQFRQSSVRSLGSGTLLDEDGGSVVTFVSSSCEGESSTSNSYWLGGEPSLLGEELEKKGVQSILDALTDKEKEEITMKDTTMPIRHLRAEKVSESSRSQKTG